MLKVVVLQFHCIVDNVLTFNIESQISVLLRSNKAQSIHFDEFHGLISSWFLSAHAVFEYSLICNHPASIGEVLNLPFHSALSEPST